MHNLKRATDVHTGIYCAFSNLKYILTPSQQVALLVSISSLISHVWCFVHCHGQIQCHCGHRETWQRAEPNLKGVKLSPRNVAFLTHLQINAGLALSKRLTLHRAAYIPLWTCLYCQSGSKSSVQLQFSVRPVEGALNKNQGVFSSVAHNLNRNHNWVIY